MNQLSFIANQVSPDMANAVIAQLGGWDVFSELAVDISMYGATMGVSNFTYTKDTVPFAAQNFAAIMHSISGDVADCGAESAADMMATWNSLECLPADEDIAAVLYYKDPTDENYNTVFNSLAWYALETCAHSYVELEIDA